jgi:exonuclease SbcD
MIKILHFADAHIDMANYGQHDAATGLPQRVVDFLKSLDFIVETAINEKVDLVIFAGDTYRDRSPAPTFQREWGKRIMRLSRAKIATLLLTGNHDVSPSQYRAHAIQEFDTLSPDYIHVVSSLKQLGPEDLDSVPVQVVAIPWITRSGIVASLSAESSNEESPQELIEKTLNDWLDLTISSLDPNLPTVLTAHASIAGAKFGSEQTVKIGRDVVLPPGLVANPAFDYVALGHIHRYQNLNEGAHPPVIYPGSIERVDFGEINEGKGFIIAEVEKGHTNFRWQQLPIRRFLDYWVELDDLLGVNEKIFAALPESEAMADAIVRLTLIYPRDLETLIDEARIHDHFKDTFAYQLVKKPISEAPTRLGDSFEASSMTPAELLELYWKRQHIEDPAERERLQKLAEDLITQSHIN